MLGLPVLHAGEAALTESLTQKGGGEGLGVIRMNVGRRIGETRRCGSRPALHLMHQPFHLLQFKTQPNGWSCSHTVHNHVDILKTDSERLKEIDRFRDVS